MAPPTLALGDRVMFTSTPAGLNSVRGIRATCIHIGGLILSNDTSMAQLVWFRFDHGKCVQLNVRDVKNVFRFLAEDESAIVIQPGFDLTAISWGVQSDFDNLF
eukprot:1909030-Prymnesium_polylepis.1